MQAQPPRALAQLRRWQRGGRCARPGCGARSCPRCHRGHAGALSPSGCSPRSQGCWGGVIPPVPSHRPGMAGGTWWQRWERPQNRGVLSPGSAERHGSVGTATTTARGQGHRVGDTSLAAETLGGGTGGHSGLGNPRGGGGSAFPLIGAANGGRFPLRGLAGGTSCATARAAF